MKDWIMLLTLCIAWSGAMTYTAEADAGENNQVIKDCLLAHGYRGDVNQKDFNWAKAASCVHEYRVGLMNEEYIKLKFFLKENPWYTGRNWQWETEAKAGYQCVKYHNTGAKVCRKPYFKN